MVFTEPSYGIWLIYSTSYWLASCGLLCITFCMLFITIGREWPLNYYFIYEVITLMVIFIVLLSFALPKSSEKKRLPDSPQQPTKAQTHLSKTEHLSVT